MYRQYSGNPAKSKKAVLDFEAQNLKISKILKVWHNQNDYKYIKIKNKKKIKKTKAPENLTEI
jgi:hypothetical protein